MFRLSLKMATARKARLLLSSLAIILGTSFLSGTAIFSATINNTFDEMFTDIFRDTDVFVRSSVSINSEFGVERAPISIDLLEQILHVDGVSAAMGDIQSFARVTGKDNKPIGQDQGPPTFGGVISSSPASIWKIESGRLPVGPQEVALDRDTALAGGFKFGETVRVTALSGTRTFIFVGTSRFGEVSAPGGATFALFDQPTASEFLHQPGLVDAIIVQGDKSASDESLAKTIAAIFPIESKIETLTGAQITEEQSSEIKDVLGFFTTFLSAFSYIALGVGCFVIYNVFSITAAQRQRESALLRALGASRRQVTNSLLVEALIVGLLGSVFGFIVGIGFSKGLGQMLNAFGMTIPSRGLKINFDAITSTVLVGTIITVISAIMPAWRAGRVSPLAAMRDTALDTVGSFGSRFKIGSTFLTLGVIGLIASLNGAKTIALGLGILGVFSGVLVLGPTISKPVAIGLGAIIVKLRGVTGMMARQNAARNPKRTARTAAPVLIGVALVTAFTALAASVRTEIRETIGKQFYGDFALSVKSYGFGGIPLAVTDQIRVLPEVNQATGVGYVNTKIQDKATFVLVFDPKTTEGLYNIEMVEGSQASLTKDQILVDTKTAASQNYKLGSEIDVTLIDGSTHKLTVAGTTDKTFTEYVVSRDLFDGTSVKLFDNYVYVDIHDGVSQADARKAIGAVSSDIGVGTLESRDEFIDSQQAQVDQILALIYGLLFLSVIIAIVGIIITLLLSVFERRREIGLLRAVGMTKSKVRTMVRWESVITSLFGAITGVILGIVMGVVIVVSLNESGISGFTLPVANTIYILIGAFVIGVLAAVFPAWRATRTEIIPAIAST